ncbi:MAG: SDR family NAD(P)-dependent oxidoreductase [Dehalococcoidia bacterium]|nr:SDR family NAD(P)-dependent oxidoreductase [Dehalococcoidia bacterium]
MKDFRGKTAVITGAASGIGYALAERCAQEGMNIVMADVEPKALADAERELTAGGASVLGVVTDVSKGGDIEGLAKRTLEAYGAVHLLFNNAGVGGGDTTWATTEEDWQWVLGVDLWGVIHGVRVFVPIMLKQSTECHVVNTASGNGLFMGSVPVGRVSYKVAKFGVVALSETLYHELRIVGSKIGVSVFCPAFVNTRIMTSERNRPRELLNEAAVEEARKANPFRQNVLEKLDDQVRAGISPQQAAECVFDAIRQNKFYILTDKPVTKYLLQLRMEDILWERNPTDPMSMSMLK